MSNDSHPPVAKPAQGETVIVRLGGIAVIIAVIIHFVINSFLKQFPDWSLTESELNAYFAEQFNTWAIVHGARYMAILAMVLFFAGVYTRICNRTGSSRGWCVVGLIGTAMLATNLMITNGIETISYLNIALLRENQELFWLLRSITGTLFTGEMVSWSLILFGFSMAGWYSRMIPKWIVYLGCVSAASGAIAAAFIVSALKGGWAGILANMVTPFTAILWFLSVGILMLWRGIEE